MTLPGAFSSLQWVAMVADADTPAESLPLNGRVVGLRPADTAGMGSGPDNPGELFGVRGYPRAGGPTGTEFLMVAKIPAATVAAFNVIPGPQGWIVPASRTTFANVGRALIDTYDLAPSLVLGALGDLYGAAVAERDERVKQGF
jgi:hypothetical protein